MADLLTGLDGTTPFDLETLTRAAAAGLAGEPIPAVTGVAIVDGTENRFPTSHSALLSLSSDGGSEPHLVFLKKVTAAAMAHKPWPDRRRTLAYIRTELRVYEEFGATLLERGVPLPKPRLLISQLDALGGTEVASPPGDEPSEEALRECGALLFLEPVGAGYEQGSPLAPERAAVALAAVANLHAASWEDRELLGRAADRLQRHGGAYNLSIRNPSELTKIRANWESFVATFTAHDPELFSQPGMLTLGERLERWAPWVAAQLDAEPTDAHATLVHGDFKAMNVFLPAEGSGEKAVLIDFASTGVGYGMADVAMHLNHAILPEDMSAGGEERLLDGYLAALKAARGPGAAEYPRELALRHYRLGCVDYGRFVVGRFWSAGKTTPDSFAAKAASPNSGLWNRRVDAALAFAARINRYLAVFEAEGAGP